MPTSLYNFQYVPLTGRLPGKSFVSQTEQAINGLAQYVYENSTNYEAVKAIAQKAEEDSSSALSTSEEALDKAQTALETVGRAYIKTTSAVDLDDYYDSELLLILSAESTNLPANITGYLTVMSSDTHDYCMQVYIGIDGSVYKRTATISNDVPTFEAWSETPITMSSLQSVLDNYTTVSASNIGVNAQTDNSIAWGNAIGGGEIASGEQRLITGGTVYPLSQSVAQNASNIATNTADIVQNTGGISANSKRISNIEKLLQGNLYDYQTDSSSAYTKSVPAGAMQYAGLEKVGGKTIVWNQLVQNGNFADGTNGWTKSATNMAISATDGTLLATIVSAVSNTVTVNTDVNIIAGHKYLIKGNISRKHTGTSSTWNSFLVRFDDATVATISTPSADIGVVKAIDQIVTATDDADKLYLGYDYIPNASVSDVFTLNNIELFDLTVMFGSGNEPPTVAEFDEIFPVAYYVYSTPVLMSAGVTSVVSDYDVLQGVTLSQGGVRSDTGVTVSNDKRVRTDFVKVKPSTTYELSVGGADSIVILAVYYYSTNDTSGYIGYSNSINLKNTTIVTPVNCQYMIVSYHYLNETSNLAPTDVVDNTAICNIDTYTVPASVQALTGYGYSCPSHYNYIDFETKKFVQEVGSREYASGDESDSTVITDGTTTYYPLTIAVETDISAYITDDNLIQVESGGTLTFENQHGDDYRIPVPSEEEYMIDLQSAIGG